MQAWHVKILKKNEKCQIINIQSLSLLLQNTWIYQEDKMVQRWEGRVCPSHTLSGWGPQGSENIPPTFKEDKHHWKHKIIDTVEQKPIPAINKNLDY